MEAPLGMIGLGWTFFRAVFGCHITPTRYFTLNFAEVIPSYLFSTVGSALYQKCTFIEAFRRQWRDEYEHNVIFSKIS
jgi:hypothetical protein